jgi:hypothetical protein
MAVKRRAAKDNNHTFSNTLDEFGSCHGRHIDCGAAEKVSRGEPDKPGNERIARSEPSHAPHPKKYSEYCRDTKGYVRPNHAVVFALNSQANDVVGEVR